MTHVVYPVRAGDNNHLPYSLRSLSNLPNVESVWVVGDKPKWLTGVNFIKGNRFSYNKPRNVFDNIRLACNHPEVPESFLLMNDDFFLMRPYRHQIEYRSKLTQHLYSLPVAARTSWWGNSLQVTLDWLRHTGYSQDPLSYELHKPFMVKKQLMAQVLDECADFMPQNPPQWRTVYGNRWQIGGKQGSDVKVMARAIDGIERWSLLSSVDGTFNRHVRPLLKERFPEPSPYEVV